MKTTFTFFFILISIAIQAQIVTIPDANFKAALIADGVDTNSDGEIQNTEAAAVATVEVSSESISDLSGIQAFVNITLLNCSFNSLTSLNITQNTQLQTLECAYNNLTSINLSNNTLLTYLWIQTNQLAYINVSNNTQLTHLLVDSNELSTLDVNMLPQLVEISCNYNQLSIINLSQSSMLEEVYCNNNDPLTILNIQNGNNINISEYYFQAEDNPNLSCIQVDNATWSTANWTNVDDTVSFDEYCGQTYIPDDNFEQALINLGYDDVIDDYVITSNINSITSLNVSNKSIADLTGIEDFVALTSLNCNNNSLISLDIVANTALSTLRCSSNDLTNLDITNNISLTYLDFSSNSIDEIDISINTTLYGLVFSNNLLTTIDMSTNINLTTINAGFNPLSNFDISTNINLEQLYCNNLNLSSLDISNNLDLEWLRCQNNNLTDLDLSDFENLTILDCSNNNLTNLNIQNGNNTAIIEEKFHTSGNPGLSCIFVDDISYSTTTWTDIDATSIFVEIQAECDAALSVSNKEFELAINLYPNPVTNLLTIEISNDIQLKKISLFDIIGKQISIEENSNTISLKYLPSGVYFVKLQDVDGNSITKKIIKK